MAAEFGGAGDLFVAAVEAIYACAARPSGWADALEKVANVFGDVGANLIWRREDGGFGAVVSPSLAPMLEDWDKWRHADIRALRALDQAVASRLDVVTDRHLVTAQEIEEHPFYTQFLAPHGLRWLASATVSPDPAVIVWMSVQRAKAKAPFSDEELETLGRLARHAEQSLRLGVRLLDAEITNVGLGDALARVGVGVFALDSQRRIIFSNPAGERLVGDGLTIVDERLCAPASGQRLSLDSAIDRVIRAGSEEVGGAPKPILIPRAKSGRPLTLYVLPLLDDGLDAAAQFLASARVIILVIDPEANAPADPAVVRDILGLTLGEARVAALVGSGLTPRVAAEKLGITEDTARVVLKRVFAKVGVSRQSELAALLTRLILR
jgi:DNA-binding CsgD family transcriptional regulator